MKNNKNYKKAFSNLYISENLERKILNMTINKDNKKIKHLKLSYVLPSLLLVCILSVSVVYAKEIKEALESWSSAITFDDGTKLEITDNMTYVNIKNDALKTRKNAGMSSMKIPEMEKMLGIKILKSELATSDIVGYSTNLNKDNSIAGIDLWLADYISYSKTKYISVSVDFLTKNASEGHVSAFEEGRDATGGKDLDSITHIEHLDVDAIIYTNEWSKERLIATFLYNNMSYTFIGMNVTKVEMLEVLNNLK